MLNERETLFKNRARPIWALRGHLLHPPPPFTHTQTLWTTPKPQPPQKSEQPAWQAFPQWYLKLIFELYPHL